MCGRGHGWRALPDFLRAGFRARILLSVTCMWAKVVSWSVMLSIAGSSSLLAGCLETYCQSGSKYGTQCYSRNEIEWQETSVRGETDDRRPPFAHEPSPGCVDLASGRVAQKPSSTAPTLAPPYVVSGACVNQREPAYGAVR